MSDDEAFAWEAPPEPWVSSKYRPAVEAVKKRPGAWLRIKGPGSQSGVYNASQGVKKLFNGDKRYEVVVRRLSETEYAAYLRYRTPEQMREE